jgi:effector-binding domain-containing protein
MLLLLTCLFLADPEPKVAFKIEAQGGYPWAQFLGAKNVALRNAEELVAASTHSMSRATNEARQKNATREICEALKIKDIDWNKQMLLVASMGSKSTGGYDIKITGAKVDEGVLKVSYKTKSPGPDDLVTQAFTYPSHVVLVPLHKGKIEFVLEK